MFKTPEQAEAGSPLFLDMVEDAKILLDADGFLARRLERGRRAVTPRAADAERACGEAASIVERAKRLVDRLSVMANLGTLFIALMSMATRHRVSGSPSVWMS